MQSERAKSSLTCVLENCIIFVGTTPDYSTVVLEKEEDSQQLSEKSRSTDVPGSAIEHSCSMRTYKDSLFCVGDGHRVWVQTAGQAVELTEKPINQFNIPFIAEWAA